MWSCRDWERTNTSSSETAISTARLSLKCQRWMTCMSTASPLPTEFRARKMWLLRWCRRRLIPAPLTCSSCIAPAVASLSPILSPALFRCWHRYRKPLQKNPRIASLSKRWQPTRMPYSTNHADIDIHFSGEQS